MDLQSYLIGKKSGGGSGESLKPGENITIINGVISAKDTTYTAGSGLELNDTQFKVSDSLINSINNKQDKLVQGDNISIDNNIISAIDTKYTAGAGLELDNTQFKVSDSLIDSIDGKQGKLTQGDNISIENNTISAIDTKYTAGSGLTLSGTQFKLNNDLLNSVVKYQGVVDYLPTATSNKINNLYTLAKDQHNYLCTDSNAILYKGYDAFTDSYVIYDSPTTLGTTAITFLNPLDFGSTRRNVKFNDITIVNGDFSDKCVWNGSDPQSTMASIAIGGTSWAFIEKVKNRTSSREYTEGYALVDETTLSTFKIAYTDATSAGLYYTKSDLNHASGQTIYECTYKGTIEDTLVKFGLLRTGEDDSDDIQTFVDCCATMTGVENTDPHYLDLSYDDTELVRVISGAFENLYDYISELETDISHMSPVTIWQSNDSSQYLNAIQADISDNPAWQLTGLDMTPYKRIKIYSCAGKGSTSASTTPGIILEMSLDSRASLPSNVYGGHFIGSTLVQKPNDNNRLATLTCAVSSDKTKFVVLRQTSLYGTAATTNSDIGANVFKIEGYLY